MALKRLPAVPRRLKAAQGLHVDAESLTPAVPRAVTCILPTPQLLQLQPVLRVHSIALTGARSREAPHMSPQQHAPPLRASPKASGGSSLGAALRREGFLAGVAAARPQGPSPNSNAAAKAAGNRRGRAGASRGAPPPTTPPQSQQSTPRLRANASSYIPSGARVDP